LFTQKSDSTRQAQLTGENIHFKQKGAQEGFFAISALD